MQPEPITPMVRADEVPWHRPRRSFAEPLLTYGELTQITDVEAVLETLSLSETAGWVLDLIYDRTQLANTLHACMDALHELHRKAGTAAKRERL